MVFVAFLAALTYYLLRQLDIGKKVFYVVTGIALIGVLYNFSPEVKKQIDRTINPDTEYLRKYNLGIAGIDDGKRLNGLIRAFPDWYEKPLLVYGF